MRDEAFKIGLGDPAEFKRHIMKTSRHPMGGMMRKVMPLQVEQLAENRTRVTASTNQLARDGHIVEPAGLMLENFLRSGTILFDHDSQMPVAKPVAAVLSSDGSSLSVDVEWATPGISARADEVRGLVKDGVLRAVSIGFEPIDFEPLDPKKPRGGMHITTAELMELSFVSVPADTGAVVTQRSSEKPVSKVTIKRGLYGVAQLACMLQDLGCLQEACEWEASYEGDGSTVPAMLGETLKQLGETLIAMTQEEVAEMVSEDGDEGERTFAAVWQRAIRAGRALSAANEKHLSRAMKHHDRALKQHATVGEHQTAASEHLDTAQDAHGKATKAHGELGEALQAVKNEPEKATEHVARCMRAHKVIGAAHEAIGEAHQEIGDAHADAQDSHNGVGRSVEGAQRCVRTVVDGGNESAEGEDGDSQDVQTSAGSEESKGSKSGRSLSRQKRIEALSSVKH